jgi:hypothetical protein
MTGNSQPRLRITFGLIFAFIISLMLWIQGCGGNQSMASPRTYGGESSRENRADKPAPADPENRADADKPLVENEPGQNVAESDTAVTSMEQPSSTREMKTEADELADRQARGLGRQAMEEAGQATLYYGQVDGADSARAVDDDIWRLFDLAEEYHAMGVIANREASWEEAQYYFDKCLKILANLDIHPRSYWRDSAIWNSGSIWTPSRRLRPSWKKSPMICRW